jgi:hypothetical protein
MTNLIKTLKIDSKIVKSAFVEKLTLIDGYNIELELNNNAPSKYSNKYYMLVSKDLKFGLPNEFKNTDISKKIIKILKNI